MHHARVLRNKLVKEYAALLNNFCPLATSPPTMLHLPLLDRLCLSFVTFVKTTQSRMARFPSTHSTKHCLSIAETATLGLLPQCFSAGQRTDAVDHCKDDRSSMIAHCLLCGSCFPLDTGAVDGTRTHLVLIDNQLPSPRTTTALTNNTSITLTSYACHSHP